MKQQIFTWLGFPLLVIAVGGFVACKEQHAPTTTVSTPAQQNTTALTAPKAGNSCPSYDVHRGAFSNVTDEHRTAAYWTSLVPQEKRDVPLMSEAEIVRHNSAVGENGVLPTSQWNLLAPLSSADLESQLQHRLNAISSQVSTGAMVPASDTPLAQQEQQMLHRGAGVIKSETEPSVWEVALAPIQMRCVPYDGGLYSKGSDHAFDKNACSSIHPQEPFEILGHWKNGLLFVRTRYAFGYIHPKTRRAPAVPEKWRGVYMNAPTFYTTKDTEVTCDNTSYNDPITLPRFTTVPQTADGNILVASEQTYCVASPTPAMNPTARPLTRSAFYEAAFQLLDTPYGYGGTDGGLDCSRFVKDVLATFDLSLPRNSKHQSMAGAYAVDVSKQQDLPQKQHLLDTAHKHGIVALYFPGHIMFYLGRSKEGVPMAIHSLGEYAAPCGDGAETVFRVKKVVVTDLQVGQGSSRRSFLERVTQIVVFSNADANAGPEAFTVPISYRPAIPPTRVPEECNDTVLQRIFQSPRRLIVGETARLIATGSTPLPHATLRIFDKTGTPVSTSTHRLDGPPYSQWTQFTPDSPGKYTAVLGDGDTVFACDHFGVGSYRSKKKARTEPSPYWQSRWKWEQDTENLYSTFIGQLFHFPPDENVSWNGLQELLNDPEHNLLLNHLGQNEDAELSLSPDCADLPYFLRAYFSWKTGLPFGVRSCSRGRKGRPPSCTEFQNNHLEAPLEEELDSEAKIFERFANVVVGWSAHSASGRTHPKFNDTDFYPVALTRESLAPGTIFADPYGHIMILTHWYPQPAGGEGLLIAVDGQPDGTIGRRRFWRGAFLFDADTDSFGAGFKRFRPVIVDKEPAEDDSEEMVEVVKTIENKDLRHSRVFAPYSLMQYENGTEAFYDRMQTLINPSPLNAEALLRSRIDALEESVQRRVQAVANGETFMAERGFNPIDMPEGTDIFQTEGPWEDYSTPSRDMRLLIAIDAVSKTPKKIFQNPKQFGYSPNDDLTTIVSGLQSVLDVELESRRFSYTRSDGSTWFLTLADVVQRQQLLETAYNPNDCIERRWGAREQNEEMATCARRAPREQVQKMQSYQNWFHTRTRPQQQ